MSTECTLRRAHWFASHGLGASVLSVLDQERTGPTKGRDANLLRRSAKAMRAQPGLYALGTISDKQALAIPVETIASESTPSDLRVAEAHKAATQAVAELLGGRQLQHLSLSFDSSLRLEGASLGLASALAFISYYTGRTPAMPVFITGAIDSLGRILSIDKVGLKLAAAQAENASDALILIPFVNHETQDFVVPVATLSDAARLVFGEEPLRVRDELVDFQHLFAELKGQQYHGRAIVGLSAIDQSELPESDQCRVLTELGSRYRHLGDAEMARELHQKAAVLRQKSRDFLGDQIAEEAEMEFFATQIDGFTLDKTQAELTLRLDGRFAHPHNRVRCRGMLAQVWAMQGLPQKSIALREANIKDASGTSEMLAELPKTLCYLLNESAMSGNASVFDKTAIELDKATRASDLEQRVYNSAAYARGLIAFGRHKSLLDYLSGDSSISEKLLDPHVWDAITNPSITIFHPYYASMRFICRALWLDGRFDDAIELAASLESFDGSKPSLAAWVGELVHLEGALALHEMGDESAATKLLEQTRELLKRLDPAASLHHKALFSADWAQLPAAIDASWY